MNTILAITNYAAFYALWFLCLWAGQEGQGEVAACAVLLYLIVHLGWMSFAPLKELCFLLVMSLLGCANETIIALCGAVQYADAYFPPIAPLWVIALWSSFASTYWYAFRWLEDRYVLASACGFFFSPLFYIWGAKAGAASILYADTVYPYMIISLIWMVTLPLSFCISKFMRERVVLST